MKRIAVVFVCLLVIVSLCACGKTDETKVNVEVETKETPEPVEQNQEVVEENDENEEVEALLAEAEQWKTDFLSSKTENEFVGKVYYVSNSGDDKNDGLSAETAWASLDKVNAAKLKPQDAVLFERDGVWYSKQADFSEKIWWDDGLKVKEGVTLGAYGEGERPILRGDEIGANDAENWSVYSEQGDARIWVYNKEVFDCAFIVFNDGQSYADKVWPDWNSKEYVNRDGSPFDVNSTLKEDITFSVLLDINNPYEQAGKRGKLYLRCDKGNPADIFDEIAIPQVYTGVELISDSTVQDMDIKYFNMVGVNMSSYNESTGMTLNGCEVSWCGASISEYQDHGFGNGILTPYAAGGAVQISGSDLTATNNFIHDCGPMTFILSIHTNEQNLDKYVYSNQLVENNLIERCGAPIHLADLTPMDNIECEGFLTNCVFKNNKIYYSGYGWMKNFVSQLDGIQFFSSALESVMGANRNDGIYIEDNVFYLSTNALFTYTNFIWGPDWGQNGIVENPPIFSGNVYAQEPGGLLAFWNFEAVELLPKNISGVLGDETGKVVYVY